MLTKCPSPIVPKFVSRDNFGDYRHVALGTSQGFLNFPKIKYLGGNSVSGIAFHVWHFFKKKYIFKNDLLDLDSLVIYRSCIALCEIRFRTMTSSPNGSPNEQNGISPGTFGDIYSFWRLRWRFRELESNL